MKNCFLRRALNKIFDVEDSCCINDEMDDDDDDAGIQPRTSLSQFLGLWPREGRTFVTLDLILTIFRNGYLLKQAALVAEGQVLHQVDSSG